jgi:tetraacyldisaccharide 4'-kinase
MRLEQRLWTGKGEGSPAGDLLRSPLWLLSGLYRAASRARRAAYQIGLLPGKKVPARVIVVGNLTVGGTGKTPLAAWIAAGLAGRGIKTAVVSRGYKGKAPGETVVVSEGEGPLAGPEAAGDEAALLAARLKGVPVVAGRDRAAACERAISSFGSTHLVLDDGFQHLALERDVDVLVMRADRDPAKEHLLPRGPLREPVTAAARAHAIVLSGAAGKDAKRFGWMDRVCPDTPVFAMRYRAAGLEPLEGDDSGDDAPCLAFCGIGSPDGFFASLEEAGVEVAEKVVFADHQRYGPALVAGLVGRAGKAGASRLVTTDKDAVKIKPEWARGTPVYVFRVEPDLFGEEETFIELMLGNTGGGQDTK